ncbi:hypothetical protein E6P97_02595 [Patescibacteria group bacterium]|nr:MAG: hypothetical protein E6P97_02595 [Patescibacteria group bacterium]
MSHNTQPLAHRVRKQLLTQPDLYVESVGKPDMLTFNDVMEAEDGAGTVIRLVMGASSRMPFRALSYVDAALRIARTIPCEQIQLVHANDTGCRINGIDRARAHQETMVLAEATHELLQGQHADIAGKVLHGEDGPVDFAKYVDIMHTVFEQHVDLARKLHFAGNRHKGDTILYAAAHVALHDVDTAVLEPLVSAAPDQILAERIVSIGSQSERPFYLARMAARQVYHPEFVETAQIFTKHVSAPYFQRAYEPTLVDVKTQGADPLEGGDRASRRDIEHFMILQGAYYA